MSAQTASGTRLPRSRRRHSMFPHWTAEFLASTYAGIETSRITFQYLTFEDFPTRSVVAVRRLQRRLGAQGLYVWTHRSELLRMGKAVMLRITFIVSSDLLRSGTTSQSPIDNLVGTDYISGTNNSRDQLRGPRVCCNSGRGHVSLCRVP